MMNAKAAFVVYGEHKDGMKDICGNLFIREDVIGRSKQALKDKGIDLVENDLIIATKAEAREVLGRLAKDDSVDCLVLFAGTWIWAAHLISAIREFAMTGKGIVLWTYPGTLGWRPVGGLVLQGAMDEIGINYRFVYGRAEDEKDLMRVVSYCRAAAVKNRMNHKTLVAFGGRGMGQTCGVADPSQWMRMFGVDIDSRDNTELLETARAVTKEELEEVYALIRERFTEMPVEDDTTDRSIRVYAAVKKMMKQNDWSYCTIQSFPGLANDYAVSCFTQSMLLEDGVPVSTLSDYNTALTSILITSLSRERTYYGDFQDIDKEKKEIKIICDGAVPPSLANAGGARFATHGILTEGKAGGLSVDLVCKAGKGVIARFSRAKGEFRIIVSRCTVFEPPKDQIEARRIECGNPQWPHAFVTAECRDMDELVENWGNEYACLGYGEELYQNFIDFGHLTGIEVLAL